MHKTYLFIREVGISGTKMLETTMPEAVKYLRENRGNEKIQIGILGGKDYETVKSVYGEYEPFKRIYRFSEI